VKPSLDSSQTIVAGRTVQDLKEYPRMDDHPEAVDRGASVPGWLDRLAAIAWRVLVVIALAGLIVVVATILATVTGAILVGTILAVSFAPALRRLRAHGWSQAMAAAATSVLGIGTIVILAVMLALAFLPNAVDTLRAVDQGIQKLADWSQSAGLPPWLAAVAQAIVAALRVFVSGQVSQLVQPIPSLVTTLILGGFLTFFLLLDGEKAWLWGMRLLQPWRAEAMTQSGTEAMDAIGGYVWSVARIGIIDSLSYLLVMWLLGVSLALPLAALAFLCAFVPYLGRLAAASAILLATLATAGTLAALMALAAIVVVNVFEVRTFGSRGKKSELGVHAGLVLVALPVSAALFGIVGLMAALPLLVFFRIISPTLVRILRPAPGATEPGPHGVPAWLDGVAQWSWRCLVVAGLGWLFFYALGSVPIVVLPAILAVVLAATLYPLVGRLCERGWSRNNAALTVSAGTALVIFGAVALAVASMGAPIRQMLDLASSGAVKGPLGALDVPVLVNAVRAGVSDNLAALLANLAREAFVVLLAALLTFYLMRDGQNIWLALAVRLDPARRAMLEDAGARSIEVLRGYMVGTGALSAFGALSTAALMLVLGLPLAIPIAVLAFFLGYIPYVGGFIATFLAFLVAVAVGEPRDVVIMAIYTVVMNIVQGNVLAPIVYSKAVSLHPAIVLLATPAGSAIAGIFGAFFVVPVLAVVAASWRAVLRVVDPGQLDMDEVDKWEETNDETREEVGATT
jgi:predicted PurR-regulated permease PerM